MNIALAERTQRIKPSATLAMSQRAAELRRQGVDVLAFGVGEPDFDTPAHICRAAERALADGATHYTRSRGIPELLEAIAADSERRRGIAPAPEEIVASVGAKHSLFNLAMVLYNPGDEVLIPAPHWVSYPAQCRIVDANPITLPTREADGFRLQPDVLRRAITERTKALILCSPSNPTGTAYTAEELRALADVALEGGDFWVIVDEIYGELVYDGFEQHSLLSIAPELRERLIVVDGVSKTYAMTGWRLGWTIAPPEVASAIERLQGQSTTNPAAVTQHAAIEALRGDRGPIEAMRDEFAKRRAAVLEQLNAIDGVRCSSPRGAFYVFPNVSDFIGKSDGGRTITNDLEFALWLLDEAKVAVVPGSAFGAPGYIRMSYAASLEDLNEGIARIAGAVARLA